MINLDEWQNCGKGKSIQFFATDEEIMAILERCLPSRYSPYTLIAMRFIKEHDGYVYHPLIDTISSFQEYHKEYIKLFYIWSTSINSTFTARDITLINDNIIRDIFTINGLIQIWASEFTSLGGWMPTIISMSERFRNIQTGECCYNEGYVDIFNQIRKGIIKSMCYITLWGDEGNEREDKRILMSEAVAEEYHAGEKFWARPGVKY